MVLLSLLISISSPISIVFTNCLQLLGMNEKKLILWLVDLIRTTVVWDVSPDRVANKSECGARAAW